MRRVVVTGLGVVAPNGIGKDVFWSACLNGKSGVGPIRTFDASKHPVKIAAEVPEFDISPFIRSNQRKSLKIMSRSMRFAVAAAGLGLQDAGMTRDFENPERVGVVMGTGIVPVDLPELAPALVESCDESGTLQTNRLGERGSEALFPLWILKYLPNMIAAHISMAINAQGPNNTITTACAAGTQAVDDAAGPHRRRPALRHHAQPDLLRPGAARRAIWPALPAPSNGSRSRRRPAGCRW